MLTQFPSYFFYIIAGLFGSVLGSFANVCVVRLPKGESIALPPSHCPQCGNKLSWWENIPVVSFIILKGRCHNCGQKISIRYPIVEIICIILALTTWWKFQEPLHFFIYFCLFVIPLVIISFIDLELKIIPDIISIPGIFVGIGVSTLFASSGMKLSAALNSALGALSGGLFLFIVAYAYEKIKKQEGLGGGDVKLIAMLGAFFGWKAALVILLFSSILGSIVGGILIIALRKDMKYAIPFGPFLASAGLLYLYVGEWALGYIIIHNYI